jgi:hypothetical protein
VFFIENTASSGSVAMSDLLALYFVTPENGVSEVRSYEQIDLTSTALNAQVLRLGYTSVGVATLNAGSSVKSTFGYHSANWTAQNLSNDYTQQGCNATGTNSKMVLCRKVDGISYQVWGTLPSYDTLGCERP